LKKNLLIVSQEDYKTNNYNKLYFLDANLEYFFKDRIVIKNQNIKYQLNYINKSINKIKKKILIYKKSFLKIYKKNNIEIVSPKEIELLLENFFYTLLSSIIYKTDRLIYLKKKYNNNFYIQDCRNNYYFNNLTEAHEAFSRLSDFNQFVTVEIAKILKIKLVHQNKKNFFFLNTRKKISINIIVFWVRLYIFIFKPNLFTNLGIGILNSFKIFLKTFGQTLIIPPIFFFYHRQYPQKINITLRKNIRVKENDIYDRAFNKLIFNTLPLSCLENYKYLKKEALFLARSIKNLGTNTELHLNENFKILSSCLKKSSKLISFQHGSYYGLQKSLFAEEYEVNNSDMFIYYKNKENLAVFSINTLNKINLNKKENITMFAEYSMPNHYRFQFVQNLPCYGFPINTFPALFYKNLSNKIKINFLLRLFNDPTSDYTKNKLKLLFKDIKFDKNYNAIDSLKETKIFVATYFSTSVYHALRMGIPFILIFNEKAYNFKKYFLDFLNKLKKNNILFNSPILAAKYINNNYNNFDNLYSSPEKMLLMTEFKKILFIDKDFSADDFIKSFCNKSLKD